MATADQRRSAARFRLLQVAGGVLRPAARPPRAPKHVLLLRPDHIGDVLLTAPAVALLRASLPAAQLTYVVGPWSVEAARHGPAVDEVRELRFPGFTRRRNANVVAPYTLLLREAARLRRERFDLAVVFRPDHWWGALLALTAGIPVRVGCATPETEPLLSHAYRAEHDEHWAERSLAVARLAVRAAGASEIDFGNRFQASQQFTIGDAARAEAGTFWSRHNLSDKRVVVLHPSAGAPLKSWSIDNWAHLADALLTTDLSVVLVGAPDDWAILSEVVARMTREGAVVACGQSLDVSAAIYDRSDIVVSVDSGAGHLAAAVGTPTVRLYGPAPLAVFGPWPAAENQRVVITRRLACVPCGNLQAPPCGAHALPACMLALTVSEVVNTVWAELGRS